MLHLATLVFVLHTPVLVDAQALPDAVAATAGVLSVDVAASLAGPIAPSAVHLTPGRAGGTEVTLHNVNTLEDLTLYLRFDGVADQATAESLEHFFRCKRTGRERIMTTGVLGLFARVASHYPGKTIEIVSGVRARGFGAKDSKHYTGHAIDFRVRGVASKDVRDLAWSLDGEIGVGWYRGEDFIHIDHRPGEPKIGWEQRRPGSANRYNPAWAALRSQQPAI